MLAQYNLAAKTNLAVSSMEFCQSLFDESYVWIRLCGGCSHNVSF